MVKRNPLIKPTEPIDKSTHTGKVDEYA